MSVAALEEARVAYGGVPALGPLSLELRRGEITAVVGPSGCGKSTALRLLAGLEAPTAGAVRRAVAPGRTAMVFQAPTLMPWASARENAALPLRLAGAPDAAARADAALAALGLAGAEGRRPAQLSGGMAMRVALARALVVEPELLLLDEPFSALDEITRRRLADDLHARWAATGGPATLFVTHSVDEAAHLAHRVLVLTPGPGRIAGEVAADAPIPRPPGFRASAAFRAAAEAVSALLARGMESAA